MDVFVSSTSHSSNVGQDNPPNRDPKSLPVNTDFTKVLPSAAEQVNNTFKSVGTSSKKIVPNWEKELINQNVKELTERGIDIDALDENGDTALIFTTSKPYKYNDLIKALINSGANVNAKGHYGFTPLISTILGKNIYRYMHYAHPLLDALKIMASKLDEKAIKGIITPLMSGEKSFKEITETLALAAGGIGGGYSGELYPCILYMNERFIKNRPARVENFIKNTIISLISDVAEDKKSLEDIINPLKSAIRKCCDYIKIDIINILLEKGADINAKDNYGWTPLVQAIHECECGCECECSKEVIKILLEKGADINAKDNYGRTPLMHAIQYGCSEEVIKILLEKGADINAKDNYGRTPLMHAIQYGCSEEVIKILLDKGADVNAKDKNGCTPLMHAIHECECSKEVIKILLEKGADINAKDNYGWTPLMHAIHECECECSKEVIKILLEKGADINAKDSYDCTPLMLLSSAHNNKKSYINMLEFFINCRPKISMQAIDNLPEGEFRDKLKKCYSNPQKLQSISGNKVRQHLMEQGNPDQTIAQKVEKLPLPKLMKKFLTHRG